MTSARILLTTVETPEDANRLATTLVEEGLATCVNILPGARSVYRWQGKVESASECLLIMKTDDAHLARLEARLAALHPYDLPELLVLTPESGSARYLDWITASLA
jgi:periplasmic divalent cation tolerance protein